MKINDSAYLKKYHFVQELSKVLNMAKPHLTCEFFLGEELPVEKRYIVEETPDGRVYIQIEYQPDGEWVVVTANNDYQYKINVSADSLAAIAEEVFKAMVCK